MKKLKKDASFETSNNQSNVNIDIKKQNRNNAMKK